MTKLKSLTAGTLAALLLAACGGGGGSNSITGTTPARGTLLKNPPDQVTVLSAATLLLALNAPANAQLLALAATPVCDVAVYHITYETVGGMNEATTASGALMVPLGLDAKCSGNRPILMYAHGTTTDHAYNIADVQNTQNVEGLFLAAFFATQGYIVVAPNYAGYDTSTLPYHPYLVADQQSKEMIDALTAARSALPVAGAALTKDGGQLYLTGYSQGGYVAMATERAMQAAGMTVTAAAPLSGPYSLAAFVDTVFFGQVNASGTESAALLVTAYQKSYGNIYASAGDVFEPQYASGIEGLLPSTTPLTDLYAQGKLPQYALFSATPPDASSVDITPATLPANLATVFAAGFGAGNLVTNTYRLSYLDDARMNPDGGWPTTTTGMTAANPGLALRRALKMNDLRNWTPSAPTLLCGGNSDPTVFWLNTQLMQGYWTANSATVPPVTVLDVDSAATAGDPYASLKTQFALAKDLVAANAVAQGATDGGAAAVLAVYHAGLVPPFCLAAAASFFASH
jgi:poly(3-hydroxybutyrate) depolymerase